MRGSIHWRWPSQYVFSLPSCFDVQCPHFFSFVCSLSPVGACTVMIFPFVPVTSHDPDYLAPTLFLQLIYLLGGL